jgi:hypothetical protein
VRWLLTQPDASVASSAQDFPAGFSKLFGLFRRENIRLHDKKRSIFEKFDQAQSILSHYWYDSIA